MRWKTKRPGPRPGERRCVTRFAWLPVRCYDGVTVWLEQYRAFEEYLAFPPYPCWEHLYSVSIRKKTATVPPPPPPPPPRR